MAFLLTNWRVVVVAMLLLALGIQTWRLDRCQSKFEEFRISTEALGRAQKAKNEADATYNKELSNDTIAAKDAAIADLSTRYAAARKRLSERPGGGGLSPAPAAPSLASACEPADRPAPGVGVDQAKAAARLAEVEAALLDLLESADREMVKHRLLYEWAQRVR